MPNTPLACALTADQLQCAAHELLPGLAAEASSVIRSGDAARLTFVAKPGLVAKIAGVIEREQQCCPFFEFRLDVLPSENHISLVVRGPNGTGDFLAGLSPAFR